MHFVVPAAVEGHLAFFGGSKRAAVEGDFVVDGVRARDYRRHRFCVL